MTVGSGWRRLIDAAIARRPQPVEARTFHRVFDSFSKPVHVACEDGAEYVIKGLRHDLPDDEMGRAMTTDQVVGRLGASMGAPVGNVGLVSVSADLIEINPEMAHLRPGVAHGCKWMPGMTDRMWNEYMREPVNRERFALLALLYGWIHAEDHQVIYEEDPPHVAYSVDHGHFLPGSYLWASATLASASTPVPYPEIVRDANLGRADLAAAARRLAGVTDEAVAWAVAAPPAQWGITMDERESLARYLGRRRDILTTSFASET